MIDITALCQNVNSIGITGHTNPDGDCVGSCLGLWQFLKKKFPDKKIKVLLEKPLDMFAFINGADEILYMDEDCVLAEEWQDYSFDVCFVLDTVIERSGKAQSFIEKAKKVVNIDHHISNEGQGDLSLVCPKASACAEVIYDLLSQKEEDKALIDKELAQTLYIGIIHDCGVMQYSNTSPKTLRIVADLVEYGFDFPKLIDETFYERGEVQSKATGKALYEAQSYFDGRVQLCLFSKEEMQALHASKKDFSGIVNQLRYVKGAWVAVFGYEITDGNYKCSLRSGGQINVSKLCAEFGGGGHGRASGWNIEGTKESVTEIMVSRLSKEFVN